MQEINKKKIKIGLIDDNAMCRQILKIACNADNDIDFDVLFELESLLQLSTVQDTVRSPDLIICDIEMPWISGVDGIPLIQKRFPTAKILMCSGVADINQVVLSISTGAHGFIGKGYDKEELFNAISNILQGSIYVNPIFLRDIIGRVRFNKCEIDCLTSRESELAEYLMIGMTYKHIAGHLNVSENTIRDQIKRIYRKLKINSKRELHMLSKHRMLSKVR